MGRVRSLAVAAVLAMCAGTCLGQGVAPQFYFWNPPTTTTWSDPQFAAMVRVEAGYDPGDEVGETAAALADSYITNGYATSSTVSIMLLGFGSNAWGRDANSFIKPSDALDNTPDWTGSEPSGWVQYQPWMGGGRADAASWMAEFIDGYNGESGPRPARFHFDSEFGVLPMCCEVDVVRYLRALAIDSRWGSEPVPGFGTDTMKTLHQNAANAYDWPYSNFDENLDPAYWDRSNENRRFVFWYEDVAQAAKDAVMKECAYDLIKAEWSGSSPFPVKTSNYGDVNIVPFAEADYFGWHTGHIPSSPTSTAGPVRTGVRGMVDGYGGGAFHTLNDNTGSTYALSSLTPPGNSYYSDWHLYPGKASGDFSAPAFYIVASSMYDVDYYRGTTTHPTENRWQASMRTHRYTLESILQSGSDPDEISPWIAFPGTFFDSSGTSEDYTITTDDTRLLLALLRSKKIEEVLVWGDGSTFNYSDFKKVYRQAYDAEISGGTIITGSYAGGSWSALVDTLQSSSPATWNVTPNYWGGVYTSNVDIDFEGIDVGATDFCDGILVLENTTSNPDVITAIRVLDPSGPTWIDPVCPTCDDDNTIGYHAPEGPDDVWDSRRVIELQDIAQYVDSGELKIRISTTDDSNFTLKFDLVQLLLKPGSCGSFAGSSWLKGGGDMNRDGRVDETDLAFFLAAFQDGDRAADINRDKSVDDKDLSEFLEDLAR